MIRLIEVPEALQTPRYLDPATLMIGKDYHVVVVGLGGEYTGSLKVGQTCIAFLSKEVAGYTFRVHGVLAVHSGYHKWVSSPTSIFAVLEITGEIDDKTN